MNASHAADAPLSVLKFGGSVLTSPEDYHAAAAEAYRHLRAGEKVIVIVSALYGHTDKLVREADSTHDGADAAMRARLVRLGEFKSAALAGLALSRLGVRTRVLDPHEIGLMAEGDPLDADLCALDRDAFEKVLADHDAVVVPGFTAGHAEHGAVTLGRGGTDLTAVFFAEQMGARRVRLVKDVDGVYTDDPARDPDARRYDRLDYETALQASRGLIQPKAIEAARAAGLVIEVAAMGAEEASVIAKGPAVLGRVRQQRPMRVALLGCGAVGSGVLDHLVHRPELFAVAPVLVRDLAKHGDDPRALFTEDPEAALGERPDVVVEVMGGADVPADVMRAALRGGAHVVTANKAAVAKHYDGLHAAARQGGAMLAYSAAVGGGVPVLELVALRKSAGVQALEGVMNGTGNFILDQLGAGIAFDDAVAEAQRLGFAEADPSADVDGHDAADKLSILVREAFGVHLPPDCISTQSLSEVSADAARAALSQGLVFKQIGRAHRDASGQVRAAVSVEAVPQRHPLAGARNEENRFLLTMADGSVQALYGKGAGRWPTAAAVFADLMDVQRAWAGARAAPRGASSSLPPLQQATRRMAVRAGAA